MSLASSLNLSSTLTPGTTTTTVTKLYDGTYSAGSGTSMYLLTMKAASPYNASKRNISISLRKDPVTSEAFPVQRAGKVSISLNCSASLGTVIAEANVRSLLIELGSLLSQTTVIDSLISGSY